MESSGMKSIDKAEIRKALLPILETINLRDYELREKMGGSHSMFSDDWVSFLTSNRASYDSLYSSLLGFGLDKKDLRVRGLRSAYEKLEEGIGLKKKTLLGYKKMKFKRPVDAVYYRNKSAHDYLEKSDAFKSDIRELLGISDKEFAVPQDEARRIKREIAEVEEYDQGDGVRAPSEDPDAEAVYGGLSDSDKIKKSVGEIASLLKYNDVKAGQLYNKVEDLLRVGYRGGMSGDDCRSMEWLRDFLKGIDSEYRIKRDEAAWNAIQKRFEGMGSYT